jgi:hypothetical protein
MLHNFLKNLHNSHFNQSIKKSTMAQRAESIALRSSRNIKEK